MANLIDNGSMVGNIDEWAYNAPGSGAGSSATHDTATLHFPSTGAIKCTGTRPIVVAYRFPSPLIAIGELSTADIVLWAYKDGASADTFGVFWEFYDHSNAEIGELLGLGDNASPAIAAAETWEQFALRDFAAPAESTHLLVYVVIDGGDAGDSVWFTDTYAGAPDGDNPPYIVQSGANHLGASNVVMRGRMRGRKRGR